MSVEDIVIGTEIANGKCVFIMAFKNKKGAKCRYFISVLEGTYRLHESSPSGVLFYSKKKSERMQEVILEIFTRIKTTIKLTH